MAPSGISDAFVSGGFCLVIAFYGMQYLPIDYNGLLSLFWGLILMMVEAYFTVGVFAVTGLVVFTIGSLFLHVINPNHHGHVAWVAIISSGSFNILLLTFFLKW